MLGQPRSLVPFSFPRTVFQTLTSYISSLSGLVAYWPLDDVSGSAARVINPAVSLGRDIVINGGFDTATGWSGTGGTWTISGGTANAAAAPANSALGQSVVAIGKTYEITYTILNYVSGLVRLELGATAGTVRAANGTYTETLTVTLQASFRVNPQTPFTGSIDNVSVRQINIPENSPAMVGATVGATVGVDSGTPLGSVYSFDGVNDFVNIYSADLNSVYEPDEWTLIAFPKVSGAGVWTDGAQRFIVRLRADNNNAIEIYKHTVSNQLVMRAILGGVDKTFIPTFSSTDWYQVALRGSRLNDQTQPFINGSAVASALTGLGAWTGNLLSSSNPIGASSTAGGAAWAGNIAHVALFNRALTDAEILRIAQLGGVA